jgi:hypothetical protein
MALMEYFEEKKKAKMHSGRTIAAMFPFLEWEWKFGVLFYNVGMGTFVF